MGRPLIVNSGDVFGNLKVIKELPRKIQPSGQTKRQFLLECECGELREVTLGNLTSGHTVSCGCVQVVHGGAKNSERLYSCWRHMKDRSKKREACNIYHNWLNYLKFKDWALQNGYKEDLVLCRNGDTGDYEPNNVRWDTQSSNAIEGLAKTYIVISPEGDKFKINNMSKFCKEHNLTAPCMHAVITGSQQTHKGWKAMVDDTADMDFDDL